ncbi:MAG TPA: DUF6194 family protein [Longimicrobium sp.]|nr:DUF6194 family protein [Longimicrobium sp.]
MDEKAITQYIADTFAGVDVVVASAENGAPEAAWGDSFFIYDPNQNLPPERRLPFATLVTQDYAGFDTASELSRPGVFRLNIDVGRDAYHRLFGPPPPPGAPAPAEAGHDFAALDRVMPHPVYARQLWVSVLNPSAATFEAEVKSLLADAYDLAVKRFARRSKYD